ncbi:DUF3883 domain-containing protein [Pigmentiphaga aceris]|uniref:DUF3883 domain-containing protein n=2 Tax=Pigmentiphaga aceris TaxID=1940612 RepID=A0A5C0B927_9BURK|nr:DUF3883 domain-containing protein [Pigmentiphaga aceris]
MLTFELNGQRYNKKAHATALAQKLDGRSLGSIEFKRGNISAVMLSLGYPYINGYKPRSNFQAMLVTEVEAQLSADVALQESVQAAVLRPALSMTAENVQDIWVPAPRVPVPKVSRSKPSTGLREERPEYTPRFIARQRDYLAQEARNRSLGCAGELFVADLEARRLHAAGQKTLSERVEHVAATQGDGLGYDVLSFEDDGRERLIEVKTTSFGQLTPFFVSSNELARSEHDADRYQLYRIFEFRANPRVFRLLGPINTHCVLDAVSYLARLAG